jgi:hypothetical protein
MYGSKPLIPSQDSAPPGFGRRRDRPEGLIEALLDSRGNRSVQRVMPQHFFHRGKVLHGLSLVLGDVLLLLVLLLVGKPVLMFHDSWSGGFLEVRREGFARAVKFAANGIRSLFGEGGDLIVAHLLVGDEEQEEAVFVRKRVQGFLNAQSEFLGFENAQGRIGPGSGGFPNGIIGVRKNVPVVPGLLQIAAMIDSDAVEPRAEGRIAAKLVHLAEGFEEHIMRGILRLFRIAEKAQREVINRAAVLGIKLAKFRSEIARDRIRCRSVRRRIASGWILSRAVGRGIGSRRLWCGTRRSHGFAHAD